ncbi:creatininase family protein [Thermincola ferriacetica]
MENKIYWGSYTSNELANLIKEDPVVVLPVGAYEQHGPHLTLNTDTDIVLEITKEAVGKACSTGIPCALLPPLWLGISEHHMSFSGTITLRQSTLTALVFDILKSLARHGVKKFLVVNGHGGNMAALRYAIDEVGAHCEVEPVLVTYWHLVANLVARLRKSEFGGISHGCELETSLKMHIAPEDVRKDLLRANVVKGNEYWSPEMFASNRVAMYKPYRQLSEYGHVGDPTKATPDFGEAVFKAVVAELARLITMMQKGDLENENC